MELLLHWVGIDEPIQKTRKDTCTHMASTHSVNVNEVGKNDVAH